MSKQWKGFSKDVGCLLYNNPKSADCTFLLCGISSHFKFWSAWTPLPSYKNLWMCGISRIIKWHTTDAHVHLQTKFTGRSIHVFILRNDAGFLGRCAADDCISMYSGLVSQRRLLFCVAFSKGLGSKSSLGLEPGDYVCVCVSQTKCLGSQKTNWYTCRLPLPAADKTGKRMCLDSSAYGRLEKGRVTWRTVSSSIFFLFVLNTCQFYLLLNEPNEIKHI